MARLIPARPQPTNQQSMMLLELLERGLDDSFVVFQPTDERPFFLVLHPQGEALLIHGIEGDFRYDATGAALKDNRGTVEAAQVLPELAGSVLEHLPLSRGMGVSGWVVVLNRSQEECGLGEKVDAYRFRNHLEDMSLLSDILQHINPTLAPPEGFDITRCIDNIAPGEVPYLPNEIPDAQQEWRQSYEMEHFIPARLRAAGDRGEAAAVPTGQGAPAGPIVSRTSALVRMTELCVESVVKETPILLSGMTISAKDVAHPSFLLPALLIAAADSWAPIVHSKNLRGGFHIKIRSNPEALLGMEVTEIHPAAPFLFFLPVTRTIRSMHGRDNYNMDGVLDVFARWLNKNGLDPDIVEDIELRLAYGDQS